MSSEIAIRVSGLGKCFNTYERPEDRLKQSLYGLCARLCPLPALRATLQQRAQACARNFWALDGINLEVGKGETVGIIGRNGSGKSTLLQIICGTLSPTNGEVQVNGRVAALLELGSGFNPEYSGRENVYLNGQLLGLTREQVEQRFDAIAAFADIGDFIEQPVKAYSSGMYVRLAFAVIAHVDADILVVDEALAVGDAFFTQKCMRFLRKFMQTGTILFVSHDTAAVKSLCQKALWLEKGKVQFAGSAKDASEQYLEAFYEEQQGKGTTTKLRSGGIAKAAPIVEKKDGRLEWINRGPLRNDICIFQFNEHAASFGTNDAEFTDVTFFDETGAALSWVVGGENVRLEIELTVARNVHSPIVGFYIKDKLGQILFGDSTFFTYRDKPLAIDAGVKVRASFGFIMPVLPKGDYSVCVAVAEGTNDSHVQLKWIHDALILKSESSSVATGLIGIPMQNIAIDVLP